MFWKRESMRLGAALGLAGGVELREKRFSCRLGRVSIAVVVQVRPSLFSPEHAHTTRQPRDIQISPNNRLNSRLTATVLSFHLSFATMISVRLPLLSPPLRCSFGFRPSPTPLSIELAAEAALATAAMRKLSPQSLLTVSDIIQFSSCQCKPGECKC